MQHAYLLCGNILLQNAERLCESCGAYTNTYSPGRHQSIMFSNFLGKCNKLSHNFLYIIIKLQYKLAECVSSNDCANPRYKRTQQPKTLRAQDPVPRGNHVSNPSRNQQVNALYCNYTARKRHCSKKKKS